MSVLLRFAAAVSLALAVVGSCATASAQDSSEDAYRPVWIPPLSSSYARLARLPTVQKELKLTDDQKVEVKAAGDKMTAANVRLKTSFRESLSQAGGREQRRAAGKEIYLPAEEMKKTLDATLSPEQMGRLKGMVLLLVGIAAINDRNIQRDLALSDDQVAKIKAINLNVATELRQMRHSPRAAAPKAQGGLIDYEKHLKNVLTDDQQALFKKMQGPNLAIPTQEWKTLYQD
jgi:hypothetical protein